MALYPTLSNLPLPNFPKPLDRKEDYKKLTFPADLIADKRNFYTQIQFVDYNILQQVNSMVPYAVPSGGMKLPIPMKINDNLVLHWSPVSLTSMLGNAAISASSAYGRSQGGVNGAQAGAAAASGIGVMAQLAGAAVPGGFAINPLMFMLFQRPEYRQFSLSWILTPRNEKESKTIKDIITECKKAASPEKMAGGFLMTYPKIAMIKMWPDNIFGHMVFKPCIVTSVQANYTAAPVASFHKNGAPTVISLTLNLQEMQFWFRSEIT